MEALTDAQRTAAMAPIDAPLMIVAAAGSGKTLVLCYRILHLISKGISPKEILAVTFTRRAGNDLHSRLESLHASGIRVGTFHSVCLSILRASPSRAGLSPNFIVFTPKMQIELLEELVGEWYALKDPRSNQERVARSLFRSEAYRLLKQIGRMEIGQGGKSLQEDELFSWAYDKYCLHLQQLNAIDFRSFIRHTNDLLESSPGILDSLGMKINYVLVDEFQDIDDGQFKLLQALCKRQQHVTVVGDDDQQIYTWRGAAGIRNFNSFTTVFGGCTVEKLEQNFRSTGAIVAAARYVIGGNRNRIQKSMRTSAVAGDLVAICECRNEQCEADAVLNHISSLTAKGIGLHEIVVLYRLHKVGLEFQHNLQARGLPCQIKSGYGTGDDGVTSVHFIGQGFFADVMSILRLIYNESDDYSWKRLLKLICPADMGVFSCVQDLRREKNNASFPQALKEVRSHLLGGVGDEFASLRCLVHSKKRKQVTDAIHSILRIVAATTEELQKLGMKDVIMNLLHQISPFREASSGKNFAGIKALLQEATSFDLEANVAAKSETISARNKQTSYRDMRKQRKGEPGRMITTRGNYLRKLRTFLDRIAINLHEHELGESKGATVQDPIVTLSTIHQAKGLEWASVILVRANDGVMPMMEYDSCDDQKQEEGLEEERRLMYVAITRAKRSIFITHSMMDGGQQAFPSRFLADIPRGLVQKSNWYECTSAKGKSFQQHKQESFKRLKKI